LDYTLVKPVEGSWYLEYTLAKGFDGSLYLEYTSAKGVKVAFAAGFAPEWKVLGGNCRV
jgi:hypothetical protein